MAYCLGCLRCWYGLRRYHPTLELGTGSLPFGDKKIDRRKALIGVLKSLLDELGID